MDSTIIVAIISAMTAVVVSVVTNYLAKKRESENDWRKQRLEHYKEFMTAMNGVLEGRSTTEGRQRFAYAANNIYLIGSPRVLQTLRGYLDESGKRSEKQTAHDELLTELVFAIRDDLGVKPNSVEGERYLVRLWSPGKE